jgi:hypothetical protein
VVLQDRGGELIDPLLDGAADPAAVLAPGGGARFRGSALCALSQGVSAETRYLLPMISVAQRARATSAGVVRAAVDEAGRIVLEDGGDGLI